jgi:hypothetical protein
MREYNREFSIIKRINILLIRLLYSVDLGMDVLFYGLVYGSCNENEKNHF